MVGETYYLTCRIPERGNHTYIYNSDDCFMKKEHSDREYMLSRKALRKVKRAISGFSSAYFVLSNHSISVGFENSQGEAECVDFKRWPFLKRFTYIRYVDHGKDMIERTFVRCCSAEKFFEDFDSFCKVSREIRESTGFDRNTVMHHPLYCAAANSGDASLVRLILKHYGIKMAATGPEKKNRSGIPAILPALPDRFDRDYIVDSDTVDVKTLNMSEYRILHRPYFRMNGSTHDKWTLNPHRKIAVDAADENAGSVAFIDYLRLFDGEITKHPSEER